MSIDEQRYVYGCQPRALAPITDRPLALHGHKRRRVICPALAASPWVMWRLGRLSVGVAGAEQRLRFDDAAAEGQAPGTSRALCVCCCPEPLCTSLLAPFAPRLLMLELVSLLSSHLARWPLRSINSSRILTLRSTPAAHRSRALRACARGSARAAARVVGRTDELITNYDSCGMPQNG